MPVAAVRLGRISPSLRCPSLAILRTEPWWWWKAQPSHLLSRSNHLARPRTHPQCVRNRLLLLADLHAHCLCSAVRRRPDRRHGGLSRRRRRYRGTCRRPRCWRAHLVSRPGRIRLRPPPDPTRRYRASLCRPGSDRRLSCRPGLSQIGVPSLPWREAFACIGAIFIGGTAWARMSLFVPPVLGQGVGDGPTQSM
jgi:hypothetical protein